MLTVEPRGRALHVRLSRPEVRNAFNGELIRRLAETFASIPPGVRAVVLEGEGKAFCAGGDLAWMQAAGRTSEAANYEDALELARLFAAIRDCPAIVVARVHGAAFGGGCGLVACADVAVASTEAKFAFSEVRLGLIPATIASHVIAKIGPGHARALFVSGEPFGAARALGIGLVHEVTAPDELDAAVEAKLSAIAAGGPEAVRAARALALAPPETPEAAARLLASVRCSPEGAEGVAAFLERRKPSWVADV